MVSNLCLKKSWAEVTDSNINVIDCIRLFDKGFTNIYVVDGNNEFNGIMILNRTFNNIFDETDVNGGGGAKLGLPFR